MTLVENSTELGMVIMLSFINNEKNKGLRIDPCGTCLTSSQFE